MIIQICINDIHRINDIQHPKDLKEHKKQVNIIVMPLQTEKYIKNITFYLLKYWENEKISISLQSNNKTLATGYIYDVVDNTSISEIKTMGIPESHYVRGKTELTATLEISDPQNKLHYYSNNLSILPICTKRLAQSFSSAIEKSMKYEGLYH